MSFLTSLLGFLSLLLFFVLELLKLVLIPLVLLSLGVYLILKRSRILRTLGVLSLLGFAYFTLHWLSPWYVIRGADRVQVFSLDSQQFGKSPEVRWMDTPPRLLLIPDEYNTPTSDGDNQQSKRSQVLVADLNARQTQWLPKAVFNLNDSSTIKHLDDSDYSSEHFNSRGNGANFYTFPSKVGPTSEFSFIGFSLPKWIYYLPSFSLVGGEQSNPTGWQLKRTYFGTERLALRDSASSPIVVELNRVWLNRLRESVMPNEQTWIFRGRFLVFKPQIVAPQRIFVLGPFNTTQNTQSTDNKSKE